MLKKQKQTLLVLCFGSRLSPNKLLCLLMTSFMHYGQQFVESSLLCRCWPTVQYTLWGKASVGSQYTFLCKNSKFII